MSHANASLTVLTCDMFTRHCFTPMLGLAELDALCMCVCVVHGTNSNQ